MRVYRTELLAIKREPYFTAARAKGLSETGALWSHGHRVALFAMVTALGPELGWVVGGTAVTEVVFALPGVGTLTVNAIRTKDYTVIQGCVLFFGAIVVVMNLLVDVAYGFIDPRMRRR